MSAARQLTRRRQGPWLSLALVVVSVPWTAEAQRAGGVKGLAPETSPSSQPAPGSSSRTAPVYETVVTASPMWTQDRNFLGTRFWKLDQGRYELELWWRPEFLREGPSQHKIQVELEIGLTRRLQLDLYENLTSTVNSNGTRELNHAGTAVELRIAIPERYGTIWGNPVVYLEFLSNHDAPDRAEARLLLGGELLTPKLLGALNLLLEANVNRMKGHAYEGEPEFGGTAAASYEVVAQHLRLGAEARVIFERARWRHAETEAQIMLGPNLNWHLIGNRLKLYATLFFGLNEDAPRFAPWVILGTGW
jgi:hypothetical protein